MRVIFLIGILAGGVTNRKLTATYRLLVEVKAVMRSLIFVLCLVCVVLFCRLLGTPTEEVWLGVSSLKDWHVYPRWEAQSLARAVPSLGPDGVNLLSKMLKYNPVERISAKQAMDHPYFDSLDRSQF